MKQTTTKKQTNKNLKPAASASSKTKTASVRQGRSSTQENSAMEAREEEQQKKNEKPEEKRLLHRRRNPHKYLPRNTTNNNNNDNNNNSHNRLSLSFHCNSFKILHPHPTKKRPNEKSPKLFTILALSYGDNYPLPAQQTYLAEETKLWRPNGNGSDSAGRMDYAATSANNKPTASRR